MKNKEIHTLVVVLIAILIVLQFIFGAYYLKKANRHVVEKGITFSLKSIKRIVHRSLQESYDARVGIVRYWSVQPEIVSLSRKLMAAHENGGDLLRYHEEGLKHLGRPKDIYNYLGYFIIAPDGTNLASSRTANVGLIKSVVMQDEYAWNKMKNGYISITKPVISDVPLPNKKGVLQQKRLTMFVGGPVYDGDTIIAIITFRIAPERILFDILKKARFGKTGETYGVNMDGELILPCRGFKSYRDDYDLVSGEYEICRIGPQFPGLTQTSLKSETTDRKKPENGDRLFKEGNNISGYMNYSGKKVIGSWDWVDEFNIGIVVEQEYNEAYAIANSTASIINMTAFGFISITILIAYLVYAYISITERHREEQKNAKDRLEAAYHARSIFLASMTHEFRTPLNAILGIVQVMEDSPNLNREQSKNLHTIYHSGEHLLAIINDVLEMSRLEADTVKKEILAFQLIHLFQDVKDILAEKAHQKNLQFVLQTRGIIYEYVKSDRTKLRQIIMNLCDNAIKYTDEGTVTVQAETLKDHKRSIILLFHVEDTGRGIEQDKLPYIFEAFYQVSADGSSEGAGLGLSITKRYVQILEGEISVRSKPGKGTRFTLKIPLEQAAKEDITDIRKKDKMRSLMKESLSEEEMGGMMNELDRNLLARLEIACKKSDHSAIQETIHNILIENRELGDALILMADDFEYYNILKLITTYVKNS